MYTGSFLDFSLAYLLTKILSKGRRCVSVQGWWVVQAEECWHKSLTPLMEKVRERMGDTPVYLSFDIDAIGQDHNKRG